MQLQEELLDIAIEQARIKRSESLVTDLIQRARLHGYTWAEIGNALGTTAQGAQQRYRRHSRG